MFPLLFFYVCYFLSIFKDKKSFLILQVFCKLFLNFFSFLYPLVSCNKDKKHFSIMQVFCKLFFNYFNFLLLSFDYITNIIIYFNIAKFLQEKFIEVINNFLFKTFRKK